MSINTNNSFKHYSFIGSQLNGSNIAVYHVQFNQTSVICLHIVK